MKEKLNQTLKLGSNNTMSDEEKIELINLEDIFFELFIKQIMMIGVIGLRNNIKRNQLLN